jgi:electron transport complex protein RnfB
MNSSLSFIQQIDAILPQTQCGLCGHRDGCLPYAKAIVEGEDANKCVPGGQPVADALAEYSIVINSLLNQVYGQFKAMVAHNG